MANLLWNVFVSLRVHDTFVAVPFCRMHVPAIFNQNLSSLLAKLTSRYYTIISLVALSVGTVHKKCNHSNDHLEKSDV